MDNTGIIVIGGLIIIVIYLLAGGGFTWIRKKFEETEDNSKTTKNSDNENHSEFVKEIIKNDQSAHDKKNEHKQDTNLDFWKSIINDKKSVHNFGKFIVGLIFLIIIISIIGNPSFWLGVAGVAIVIRYIIKRPLIILLGLAVLYFLIKFIKRAWES
ncbi:MAG: hypothetical protein WC875_02335 [Candidatus Absconditabacterales bacterium]